jgi:hypothetical protein
MRNVLAGILLAMLFGFPAFLYAQQQQRTELKVMGLKPGSGENASPVIRKALEQCVGKRNITIILPGGRIDLWPEGSFSKELFVSNATEDDSLPKTRNIAFLLEDAGNIRIEGNNTLVMLHGKMVSFAIINCSNISIRNLSFDMERPTMSEMTIDQVSPDSILASVHPDSKYSMNNGRLSFYGEGWTTKQYHTILFDPAEQKMTYSSFKPFEQGMATERAPGMILFKGSFAGLSLRPGNVLTIRDPYRDNCGAFISQSKNISLNHLNMHYMHGLGIVAQFSENLSYKNVRVAPAANSSRIISSFADCFHFSGCKGKILIDSCLTSGSHDDPINVHGTHLKITSIVDSGKVRVRFMHHQTYGFKAFFNADSIAFIDPQSLKALAYAKLTNARLLNSREMELTFNPSALKNIPAGTCIENISWTPEVVIRNSRFERTNTRGILVTTRRKVMIENNVFYKTGMHAILIADDAASWYESGAVTDLTIRNNVFEECGYNSGPEGYVISIAPENHKKMEGFYVHRNIRIENNIFNVSDPAILGARSVQGLIFRNNKIAETGKISSSLAPTIKLDGCNNVSISLNTFKTGWTPSLEMIDMANKKIETDIRLVRQN